MRHRGVELPGSSLGGFVTTLNGRQIPADAPGDPCRGGLDRVPRKVSIPRGRLDLRVTEHHTDLFPPEPY